MEIIKGNQIEVSLDTELNLAEHAIYEIGYIDPEGNSGKETATDEGDGILSISKTFDIEGDWRLWSIVDNTAGEPILVSVYDVPEEDVQITTLPFVKKYLGIDTDNYDFKILQLIPMVERDYETIQNMPLTIYPQGSEVIAAEMIGYKLFGRDPKDGYKDIDSEKVGSYSVSYKNSIGYPKSITSSIKKYTRFVS